MAIIKKCKIMNAKDSVEKKGGRGEHTKRPRNPNRGHKYGKSNENEVT